MNRKKKNTILIFGSNKGMSKIPLFAIFRTLGQIREFSLIWSHDCSEKCQIYNKFKIDLKIAKIPVIIGPVADSRITTVIREEA